MAEEIPGLNLDELYLKGFKIHRLSESSDVPVRAGRRDFYKMGLINGNLTILYGGREIEIDGTVLFFVNPKVPHSIVKRINRTGGYACIFTASFINSRELQDSPLFSIGDNPVVQLNKEQSAFMSSLFQQMLSTHNGNYVYKSDLIRNCISLIIHEALKIQPSQQLPAFKNGASRIVHLFTDLLEKQFPIERSSDPLKLRTAQDFASALSVHVNYLNRMLKEITGKPTSAHIIIRVVAEAKALLQHTDWSIAEIAYALGFEYPSYFNNYFKRATGITPASFRKV